MICPNCHSEYSSLNPCGCSGQDFPPPPPHTDRPEDRSHEVVTSALKPTGITDPFWH